MQEVEISVFTSARISGFFMGSYPEPVWLHSLSKAS